MGSGSGSRLSDIIEWLEDNLQPKIDETKSRNEPHLSRRERERRNANRSWVPRPQVSPTMPINPPKESPSDIHILAMSLSPLYQHSLIVIMIICAVFQSFLYAGIILSLSRELIEGGGLASGDQPDTENVGNVFDILLLSATTIGGMAAIIVLGRVGTFLGVFIGLARQHMYSLLATALVTGCLAIIWGLLIRQPLSEAIAMSSV